MTKICTGAIFRQITTFIKLIDFTKIIFQLKGLKPKNKGHTNFYECINLTKKYTYSNIILLHIYVVLKKISPSQTEILYCDRGSCFCASLSCDFLNPTSVRQTLFRPFKCQVHYIVLQTRCEFDAHFLTYLALQSRQKMGENSAIK